MKQLYEDPNFHIILLSYEDVVTLSEGTTTNPDPWGDDLNYGDLS